MHHVGKYDGNMCGAIWWLLNEPFFLGMTVVVLFYDSYTKYYGNRNLVM